MSRKYLLQTSDARPRASNRHRNLISICSGKAEMCYCDPRNVIHLIQFKQQNIVRRRVVKCNPAVNFEVLEVQYNENGSSVFLRGENTIAYFQLPQTQTTKHSNDDDDSSGTVEVHTVIIGAQLFMENQELQIVKVQWHPMSLVHLAVLYSDNVLRIYNLSRDKNLPEQTLDFNLAFDTRPSSTANNSSQYDALDDVNQSSASSTATSKTTASDSLESFKVTSFTFGTGYGWKRFAVWFITSQGEIFIWLPVIPYNCLLPTEYVQCLLPEEAASLSEVDYDTRQHQIDEYTTTNNFLSEVIVEYNSFSHTAAASHNTTVVSHPSSIRAFTPTNGNSQIRQSASFSFSASTTGEPTPTMYVRTRAPDRASGFHTENFRPRAVAVSTSSANSIAEATDIAVIGASPDAAACAVLVTATDGTTMIHLLLNEPTPMWPASFDEDDANGEVSLVHFETVETMDTQTTEESTETSDAFRRGPQRLPVLKVDGLHSKTCYVVHKNGVHRLHLSYLCSVDEYLETQQNDDANLLQSILSTGSVVHWILDSQNLAPLGIDSAVNALDFGLKIFVLDQHGTTLHALNNALPAMTPLTPDHIEPTPPSEPQSTPSSLAETLASFDINIDQEGASVTTAPLKLLRSKFESKEIRSLSNENLTEYMSVVNSFSGESISQMHAMHVLITNRCELMKRLHESLSKIAMAPSEMNQLRAAFAQTIYQLKTLLERQQELTDRAQRLMERLRIPHVHSIAESKLINATNKTTAHLPALESKVQKLKQEMHRKLLQIAATIPSDTFIGFQSPTASTSASTAAAHTGTTFTAAQMENFNARLDENYNLLKQAMDIIRDFQRQGVIKSAPPTPAAASEPRMPQHSSPPPPSGQ